MSGHELLLNVAGGVALLLWATRMIRTGIMRAYGSELRRFLGQSTRKRLSSFAMGLGIAGLLQSSTATALLTVSFTGRGLVATAAGLAVMLGADVGSTLVVQVLSFDVAWMSPAFLLAGVVAFLSTDRPPWRHLGRVAIGLGLMLLSLTLIVGASEPLRGSESLALILNPLSSDPLLAVMLAALMTWLAHSSVAIVLLVMSLTATQVIPLALGCALVLGANIGSGLVPLLLTASSSPAARRIPLGNLVFRTCGALAALPFIAAAVPFLDSLGGDPGRQIANFHTGFNLALAAVCLPLVGLLGWLMERLLPDAAPGADSAQPKYLDESVIDQPQVALAGATREVLRMADIVESMLQDVIEVFRTNDTRQLAQVSKTDDSVDQLHEAIKLYLSKVSRNALDEESSKRCIELITFTTNLEHIGDIIDKNLLELAQKKIKQKLNFSEEGWSELTEMHARVMEQMRLAMSVFVTGDVHLARQLMRAKEQVRRQELADSEAHLQRLRSGQLESIESSALHLDMLRDFKRINSHLTSVAYPILDAEGELRQSRLVTTAEGATERELESDKERRGADLPNEKFEGVSRTPTVAKQ